MTGKRRIDRVTAEGYLDGLGEKDLASVRTMRDECRQEETVLSFERRLLHARIDLLRAELDRRAGGASLMERLPSILAADDRPASRGGYPMDDPVLDFDRPKRRVEMLISDDTLANMTSLPPEQIDGIIATLSDAERDVSEQRRSVQRVLDAINAEIARRYKSGEADPADVLTG